MLYNDYDNTLSVYQVNTTTGAFTQVSGSPFATTDAAGDLAFSPVVNGNLFAAVTDYNDNVIYVYSVNTSTGALTQVSGSPFATGIYPGSIAFTPTIAGNLFAVVNATDNEDNSIMAVYQVNTSTGLFTQVSGSPFADLYYPLVISPLLSGNIFVMSGGYGDGIFVAQMATLVPAITTLSQSITSGNSVTLNGTISGGTEPYSITWQDSTVQSGITTDTFSRTVSPTSTTTYYVSQITDTNSCSAGPSNSVTITVTP
jgi:hypothetical protein